MNGNGGRIVGISGNLITVEFQGAIRQNEMGFALGGEDRLKSEVIRIRGNRAELQVYEETRGLRVGDGVEFSGELLSVQLGPGLMSQVYDGLQNPLPKLAEEFGYFLPRGVEREALDFSTSWDFTPEIDEGLPVSGGHFLGRVREGIFQHRIMVPFNLTGDYTVASIKPPGSYTLDDSIAVLETDDGHTVETPMHFAWPVKIPIRNYRERLKPREPLITKIRIIDTLFPIAKGGTYCIPGPFGAGKTILQQIIARYAEVDVVVLAACGERAGEVVESLREFPKIEDPKTGRSLMERTIIICNTSSMPVASRESSVYTAITIAEYYRQMGLHVLLLADSTSRWAQAMREISGRLEEIPGDEAYPAYLESRIASFYERAGLVRLFNGDLGSVTIGGTVSPAGGTFEEPVTQGTLKVVGAFHGLSRARANARRFPSIDLLESWSTYQSFIAPSHIDVAKRALVRASEVNQMMKVLGEEGTSTDDFVAYLKGEFVDSVYLQQNALDETDGASSPERQSHVFGFVVEILEREFTFNDKEEARRFFQSMRQRFVDWNYTPWDSAEFGEIEGELRAILDGTGT